MPEDMLKQIADNAEMIIAGYSFSRTDEGYIRILNLANPSEACVLTKDGIMIETTMNDITLLKVQSFYLKNREFMEDENA